MIYNVRVISCYFSQAINKLNLCGVINYATSPFKRVSRMLETKIYLENKLYISLMFLLFEVCDLIISLAAWETYYL